MQLSPYTIDITLGILAVFAIAQNIMLRIKIRSIFKGDNGINIEQVLRIQKNKIQQLETKIAIFTNNIEKMASTLTQATQKISILHFNSFEEHSANQSFTIAMLDGKNNGFIFTGLQMRDQMRTYLKVVQNGKTERKLSDEEESTLGKAIKNKSIV